MTIFSPSAKLLAVVHVGSVSGGSPQQGPLDGAALDECRQILTETGVHVTEPYTVKVTKHALDDAGDGGFESLTLVPDSTCVTVCNGDTCVIFVCLKV